jgi:ribosomal protein L32
MEDKPLPICLECGMRHSPDVACPEIEDKIEIPELPTCSECGMRHKPDVTCQEIEDRFDGYPKDLIIEELLDAEAYVEELTRRLTEGK